MGSVAGVFLSRFNNHQEEKLYTRYLGSCLQNMRIEKVCPRFDRCLGRCLVCRFISNSSCELGGTWSNGFIALICNSCCHLDFGVQRKIWIKFLNNVCNGDDRKR